jgi:hypothetical protein
MIGSVEGVVTVAALIGEHSTACPPERKPSSHCRTIHSSLTDNYTSAGAELQELAKSKAQAINRAYEQLMNSVNV